MKTPSKSVKKSESLESTRYFRRKKLNEIFFNFFFFGLWGKIFPTFVGFFGYFAKTAFKGSKGKFWRKKGFQKKIPLISEFELMNCRVLAKKRQSSKLLCTCPKERFLQNCCGEQVCFWPFPNFQQKNLGFFRKMLEQLSNIPSTCPQKFSEGTNIGGKSIWNRFRTLATMFWNFGQKFSADLSELSS